nr:MAG TPA: hypothetical protein [Caudoviricetes sp.]
MNTAILVDGGFYRRRAQKMIGEKSAKDRAEELNNYCWRHLSEGKRDNKKYNNLYRIFYYDCPPMSKKVYHPFLKKQIDFSKTELHMWMSTFLTELKHQRKMALRLGKLADAQAHYTLRDSIIKGICNGTTTLENLKEQDFMIDVDQKGVDMKIGLDIASLAYKNQVDQIILISGDSDFVPAAKLARREGIDFVLDPLGAPIKEDLFEHIDGLRTCDSAYKNK